MVNLDIQVTGLASVNRAFQQIEARAKQLDSKLKAAGSGGARSGAGRQVNEAAKAERAAAAEARKAHQEKMRQIKQQDAARVKAIRKAEQEERKAIASAERRRRAAVSSIHKSLSSTIAGVTKAIAAAVALLGGISAKTAIDDRLKAGTKATQVSITAHGSDGDKRSLVQRRKDLLGVTKDVSVKTGTSQNDLMDMIGAFVSKGGSSQAIEKDLEFYDKVARVTGTEHKDIGDLAASTFIGLTDEGMSAQDALAKTREQMLMFATNAKNGSFELNDFAATAGLAAGAAKKFEGGLTKNFDLMNALGQIAVGRGGARPAEANTAVSRLPSDIQTNAGKFKKLGVNVFNDKGALKNPVEIFKDVFKKTGGRMDKIPAGLLGAESRKIFDPMASVYRDAFDKAGGGKAGEEAGNAAIEKMLADFSSGKFGMKELNEASDFQQQDDAVRATKAMNELKIAMADELVPVLVNDIIPALKEAMPGIKSALKLFSKFVEFGAQNPVATALTAVGLSITKAGLGTALSGLAGKAGGAAGALGGLQTSAAAAMATLAWLAALDQGDKLEKEAPGTWDKFVETLPGFGKGKGFDFMEFMGDVDAFLRPMHNARDPKGSKRIRNIDTRIRAFLDHIGMSPDQITDQVLQPFGFKPIAKPPGYEDHANDKAKNEAFERRKEEVQAAKDWNIQMLESAVKAGSTLNGFTESAIQAKAALDDLRKDPNDQG